MPAMPSFLRMSDCFSRVLGMKGLAAAWPTFCTICTMPLPETGAPESLTMEGPGSCAWFWTRRLWSLESLFPPVSARPITKPSIATAPKTRLMSNIMSFMTKLQKLYLHFDRRELADRPQTEQLQTEGDAEQLLTE